MDDIQAEIHARRRHMHGVDLEDHQLNTAPRPHLPPLQSHHNMPGRRITLFQGAEAGYARNKSHHSFDQSEALSTVPRSLNSLTSPLYDYPGISTTFIIHSRLTQWQKVHCSRNPSVKEVAISTETQVPQDIMHYLQMHPKREASLLMSQAEHLCHTIVCPAILIQ